MISRNLLPLRIELESMSSRGIKINKVNCPGHD